MHIICIHVQGKRWLTIQQHKALFSINAYGHTLSTICTNCCLMSHTLCFALPDHFLQQSIFLVVIIESFADLRGDSALGSSQKDKDKPVIVLEHSDENLRLQYLKNHESTTAFEKTLKKYYFNLIERLFLVLVLVDAVVTATKHTGMSETWVLLLRIWQASKK